MLGAFAEFERAKITERMTRGRLHRLRMGELSSTGHRIYGYHYVKKTPDAPASLVINEEQAAIVRSIFEMFASGNYGIVNISRFLEERRIPTRTGRAQWDRGQIKFMLKNETYAGTRYYNRITAATDANRINNICVGFQKYLYQVVREELRFQADLSWALALRAMRILNSKNFSHLSRRRKL